MNSARLEIYFFIAALAAMLILTGYIFLPYLAAIVLALTFATVFHNLFEHIRRAVRFETLASFLTVLLIVIVVLLPLAYFGYRIFAEASGLLQTITSPDQTNPGASLNETVRNGLIKLGIPGEAVDIERYTRAGLNWVVGNLSPLFSGLVQVFLTLLISLFGLFYLLKDGDRFRKKTIELLPLEAKYAEEIFAHMEKAVNSVIRGTLTIAIIQGIVAGLGFTIFGVPNPVFWGSFAVLAALVPTLGTSLVNVPAAAYLFLTGNVFGGVGLLIWGAIVVGTIDNFLAPQILHRGGIEIHPFLILLSILGGITLFGPIGFLVGPLAMALLVALLDIYPRILAPRSQ